MIFEFQSPAKINLFLRIIGKYNSGYHKLVTYFQLVDLCDTMKFYINTSKKITISGIDKIKLEDNLIYKAAKLLLDINSNYGVHIEVNKKIPIGAGLGGGSSNAATTLIVLNRLLNINIKKSELIKFGSSLGADIPFFIHGKNSYAVNTGDVFIDRSYINEIYDNYNLIIPEISISTASIFNHSDLYKLYKVNHVIDFNEDLSNIEEKLINEEAINDLELIVAGKYPIIKDYLGKLGKKAKLTGTGSTIFIPSCVDIDSMNFHKVINVNTLESNIVYKQLENY